MDLNILIAALGLLVAALAEMRAAWRDKTEDQIKPIGVILIQMVFALDRIIDTGDELIGILANVPLKDETVYGTLQRKKEILDLVQKQRKNLQAFDEMYNASLDQLDPQNDLSVGDTVKFMTSTQPIRTGGKGRLLDTVEWKLMESELQSTYLGSAARKMLSILAASVKIDDSVGDLEFQFPTKIRLGVIRIARGGERVRIEGQDTVSYDLTKRADVRRLFDTAQKQLNEMRSYRQQLAQFVQSSFSLDGLMKP